MLLGFIKFWPKPWDGKYFEKSVVYIDKFLPCVAASQ